jgi:aminoglycoside phosphotransferase family enzyme/adenylate kinase family enzyme
VTNATDDRWNEPFATLAETHISTVFFAGDRAFKLLKAVRTGFLDHSTPALRGRAARREVELNRRVAPDVYLGVSELLEDGIVADHLIVMRRLPAARRLSVLVHGAERDEAVRQVARAVAIVHAALPPDVRAGQLATRDAVRALWHHNFEEMSSYAGRILDAATFEEIRRLVDAYLAGRDRLFAQRIAAGFARDGHGDLLADDIFCLPDGPRILDCLAFDDDLRLGDILLDVAFLVMDLERLANPQVSAQFLRWYQQFSNERHPGSLTHHYVAYRALVRSKVMCLRAEQKPEAIDDARALLDLCLHHLRAARVRLVLVGGAPGTGKSTTARGLAEVTGFALLSSDEARKDLAGIAHDQHAFAALGEGIYAASMSARVYDALLDRAGELLALSESVIVDASWTSADHRVMARRVARGANADIVELRCVLEPEEAARRIEARLAAGRDPSDATSAIARQLAEAADSWPESLPLDTARAPSEVLAHARAAVDANLT